MVTFKTKAFRSATITLCSLSPIYCKISSTGEMILVSPYENFVVYHFCNCSPILPTG